MPAGGKPRALAHQVEADADDEDVARAVGVGELQLRDAHGRDEPEHDAEEAGDHGLRHGREQAAELACAELAV
jgi:hypothetical protein